MASKKASIELTNLGPNESKQGPTKRHVNSGIGGSNGKKNYSNLKVVPLDARKSDSEESGLLGSKRGGRRPRTKSEGSESEPATPKMKVPEDEKQRQKRRANVAQYAAENFLNFVEFFQLYGLLWAIMFQVQWPTEWLFYTSWTLFVNIDVSMFYFYMNYTDSIQFASPGTADPHFNLWGEVRHWGLAYTGIWAFVAVILMILLICIHTTKESFHVHKFWQRPWLERVLQWFFYVFYMPIGIALLRPFACSYSDFLDAVVMDHDTTQECWRFEATIEGWHGIACVIYGIIGGVFLLYIPSWTMTHLKRHIVYEGRERHEHFIQQKQAEYVFGINNHYMAGNMSFFSSFKQPGTAFRFLVLLRKLAYVLIYVFARGDIVTQLGLLWGIQMVWIISQTVLAPYRVRGSNVVMLFLDYTYAILGLLCLLRGSETNSDAFVDSTFQYILIGVVGFGLLCAVLTWMTDGGCLACNPQQYQVHGFD